VSEGPGDSSFADVLNGVSGGAKRRGERRGLFRRRRDDADDAATDEGGGVDRFPVAAPRPDAPAPGRPARPDGPGAPEGSQESTPPWGLDRFASTGEGDGDLEHADDGEHSSFVRPYAWTGGRTRPVYQLALETLISLGPKGRDPGLVVQYEHRAVAELCREPVSVAEVAALLKLPLGVARVLLGDMASHGTVVVHQTASSSEEGPDRALMERVLSGLRRL